MNLLIDCFDAESNKHDFLSYVAISLIFSVC